MALKRQLTNLSTRGPLQTWDRVEARFHQLISESRPDKPEHALGYVDSFLTSELLARLCGARTRDQLLALLGPVLIDKLTDPVWKTDGQALFVHQLHACYCACVLEADGLDLPTPVRERVRDLLAAMTFPRKASAGVMFPVLHALTSIYFDVDAGWQVEADLPWRGDYPFQPGRTFGPNLRGLTTYLGAGARQGASFADVQPALDQFVALFDTLSDAGGTVVNSHLMVIGLAVGHRFAHIPRERVVDWWGEYLRHGFGLIDEAPPETA